MSKSGVFAHFGSKEEVQVSLLRYAAQFANAHVVAPTMAAEEGLPRLQALIRNWLGWAARAGLGGGCPVAAGLFELDDAAGPVRDEVAAMEQRWRGLLEQLVQQAVARGHLRRDLDVAQFVWELCGIYLSHHASSRFIRDPRADERASVAVEGLIARSRSRLQTPPATSKNPEKRKRPGIRRPE